MTPELRRHIETTLLLARNGCYTSPADYTRHVTTLLAHVDAVTAERDASNRRAMERAVELGELEDERDHYATEAREAAARVERLEAENADLRERAAGCALNAADLAGMLTETVDRHADALTVLEERVRRLEEAKTLEVSEPALSREE